MVLPTSLKAAAASDVRSTPTSVPQVAYRDPIDDSSVVSGRLPESAPSPDDSSELPDPPITTMQELLDTIQNTLTLNRRRVDEEIAASARASLEAVDALSARFETLFHNNVTQRRPSLAQTPAPVTFRDLQVEPVPRIDIEDALLAASLRPDNDAPRTSIPRPSQSGDFRSTTPSTDSRPPAPRPSNSDS